MTRDLGKQDGNPACGGIRGAGREIRNAAVKGNASLISLAYGSPRAVFLFAAISRMPLRRGRVFPQHWMIAGRAARARDEVAEADRLWGPQSCGAAPAAGSSPRHKAGCVRLGPRPPSRPPSGTSATRTELRFGHSCADDVAGSTCNAGETQTEGAAAFRGLQITDWEKTILGCGERRGARSLRGANEAGQCLVFAHRSSGCHLGWQIIKCVNQGQGWKRQGEAHEARLAARHRRGNLVLRRGGWLAGAPDQSSFSSRKGQGQPEETACGMLPWNPSLRQVGNFRPNPSASTSHLALPRRSARAARSSLVNLRCQSQSRRVLLLPAEAGRGICLGKFLIVACN